MATINLGSIKFNWKGAYNNSTAYAVDDVVSSGGNSYVCIQASQGNAVGNATAYWNIMSSAGTNGTNGTDVGTTLTTQGDILYRDGSGLQRLAKGTAGKALLMNSGANAPEWGDASGGKVLQAISAGKGNTFVTSSSSSYVDVTDMAVSITPSATTSKILIHVSLGSFQSSSGNGRVYGRIKQAIASGSTTYPFLGNAATGHEAIVTSCFRGNSGDWQQMPVHFTRLTGAIGTTSAVTYTFQMETDGNAGKLNSSYNNDGNSGNCSSAITVMEIGA